MGAPVFNLPFPPPESDEADEKRYALIVHRAAMHHGGRFWLMQETNLNELDAVDILMVEDRQTDAEKTIRADIEMPGAGGIDVEAPQVRCRAR